MQYSASDCYNTVGECTHQFLQRLEETLSVQVRSPASPLAVLACAAVLHHNGPFTPSPPLFVFVSRMCSGANGRAIQGAACDPGIYLPSAAGQCVRVHAHECQFLLLRYFVFLIIYLRFLSPTRLDPSQSHHQPTRCCSAGKNRTILLLVLFACPGLAFLGRADMSGVWACGG